jgi:hypothetical protein
MFDKEQSNLDQNSSLNKSDGTVVKWFGVKKNYSLRDAEHSRKILKFSVACQYTLTAYIYENICRKACRLEFHILKPYQKKIILRTKILKIRLQRAKSRCLPYKLN